jgi:osmotically-inducible protein OsmY
MTDEDKRLQDAVLREFEWEATVDVAHVEVSVEEGAVTLTGHVASYWEKLAAVHAAERVHGVRAVADELAVELADASSLDDAELARSISQALEMSSLVPDTVRAEVRNGHVTLRGEVQYSYQREAAARTVHELKGVKGVTNLLTIKPGVRPEDLEERISEAITRAANLDARQLWVTTSDGTVILHGTVHSLYEKKLAEREAAAAPGVTDVKNEIVVVP